MGRHEAVRLRRVPAAGVRTPAFRRLLLAWTASLFADGVRLAALPLVAALLTGSPLAVTAVAAAELLPWLLISLPAGALVDRWNGRIVLVVAQLSRASVALLALGALLAGRASVPVLCVLAFLLTVGETFADGASQVLLVTVAGEDDLLLANARLRTAESLALNLAGPLLGGVLVALAPAVAFGVVALGFGLAAAAVATLPRGIGRRPAQEPVQELNLRSLADSVREGLLLLRQHPTLRLLVLVTAVASLATGAANALYTLLALQVLGLGPALVPLAFVLEALGVLLGAQVVARLAGRWGEGPVMVAALLLVGGSDVVLGLVPVIAVAVVCAVLNGAGFALWNVLASARRQHATPAGMLGRVSAASRTLTWGAMPLGALAGGLLAAGTSIPVVYVAAGGLVVAMAVAARGPLTRVARVTDPAVQVSVA